MCVERLEVAHEFWERKKKNEGDGTETKTDTTQHDATQIMARQVRALVLCMLVCMCCAFVLWCFLPSEEGTDD